MRAHAVRLLLLLGAASGCTTDPVVSDAGLGPDAGRDAPALDAGGATDAGAGTDAPGLDGGNDDAGSDGGAPAPTPILATTAALEMTAGFNVGNTFDTDQHPRTAASVNAMIDAYHAEGFRMVRLPVRWLDSDWDGEPALASAAGVVDRTHPRLAVIEAIVDHAIAEGMYVVLNTHHEDWLFETAWSEGQRVIFAQLWSDICEIFADRGYHLVFEVVNEPHGTIEHDSVAVDALNQSAYDVIRACGGLDAERIIVLDGEDYGSPASLRATWSDVTDIPGGGDDPYLMGSIHYYSPLALTHATDAAGIDTPWTVASIRTSFDAVETWADGRLPIFVGELGVNWNAHAHVINDNVRDWYAAVATEARARAFIHAVWDDGGWYRVMDRDDQTFDGLEAELIVP